MDKAANETLLAATVDKEGKPAEEEVKAKTDAEAAKAKELESFDEAVANALLRQTQADKDIVSNTTAENAKGETVRAAENEYSLKEQAVKDADESKAKLTQAKSKLVSIQAAANIARAEKSQADSNLNTLIRAKEKAQSAWASTASAKAKAEFAVANAVEAWEKAKTASRDALDVLRTRQKAAQQLQQTQAAARMEEQTAKA